MIRASAAGVFLPAKASPSLKVMRVNSRPVKDSSHAPHKDPYINPAWAALQSTHAHFAMHAEGVCKYPADVAPFAAVEKNDEASLRQLLSITAMDEAISLIGDRPPAIEGFTHVESLAGLQMIYPQGKPPTDQYVNLQVTAQQLTDADAAAMVKLTELAFPGYFRRRTCEMGRYYGVFDGNNLIAMTGERLAFDDCREVSGVVTHPAHTGKGLAATLINRLMQDHLRDGLQSFLHVAAGNTRAIALYQRLGYSIHREVTFHRIRRSD